MTEYVTEEPKKATVWVDSNGRHWQSREQAIRSNFETELMGVIESLMYGEDGCYSYADELFKVLLNMAEKRPDLLRKLLD
jgi:protein associated with RNAse G/E